MTPDTPPARQQRDEALLQRAEAYFAAYIDKNSDIRTTPQVVADFAAQERDDAQTRANAFHDGREMQRERADKAERERDEARNHYAAASDLHQHWAARATQAESRLSLAEALLRRCSELSTECHPSGALCDDIARFLAPPRDGPGEKCGVRYLAYGNPCVLRAGHDGDHFYAAAALASLTPAAPGAWGQQPYVPSVGDVCCYDSEPTNPFLVVTVDEDGDVFYRPMDRLDGARIRAHFPEVIRFVRKATAQERAAAGLPVEAEPIRIVPGREWRERAERAEKDVAALLEQVRVADRAYGDAVQRNYVRVWLTKPVSRGGDTVYPGWVAAHARNGALTLVHGGAALQPDEWLPSEPAPSPAASEARGTDPHAADIRQLKDYFDLGETVFGLSNRWPYARDCVEAMHARLAPTPPVSDAGEIGAITKEERAFLRALARFDVACDEVNRIESDGTVDLESAARKEFDAAEVAKDKAARALLARPAATEKGGA